MEQRPYTEDALVKGKQEDTTFSNSELWSGQFP